MDVKELMGKLEELVDKAPTLKELDGWVPVAAEGEYVQARKKVGKKIVIKPFKAEDVWKQAYDYLVERKRLLDKIEAGLGDEYEIEKVHTTSQSEGSWEPRYSDNEEEEDKKKKVIFGPKK